MKRLSKFQRWYLVILAVYLLTALANYEQIWITIFGWYALLVTAMWIAFVDE